MWTCPKRNFSVLPTAPPQSLSLTPVPHLSKRRCSSLRVTLAIWCSFLTLPYPISKSCGFKVWNMHHLRLRLSYVCPSALSHPTPSTHPLFHDKWSPCFPSCYLLRSPFCYILTYHPYYFYKTTFPIMFFYLCNNKYFCML